jgi:hypothetical protein
MSALQVMKACDVHGPAADRAHQGEHLVDARNQHRPEVMRWGFGRWGNQGGDAVDQLQGREVQFVRLGPANVGTARLAVLLATAVDEFAASLAQPRTSNRWARTIA